jgi:hypothetical protein
MILSQCGEIVNNEWLKTKEIRKNVLLDSSSRLENQRDEYIIMPNHLYAIVVLNKNGIEKNGGVATHGRA